MNRLQKSIAALLISYTALIAYLCLTPLSEEPVIKIWDKAAHLSAYFGFAVLATFSTRNKHTQQYLLLAVFLYGCMIEVLQGQTSFRSLSVLDQLANTLGIVVGYGFYRISTRHSKWLEKHFC